jgi:L-fucose isomerase-like protein
MNIQKPVIGVVALGRPTFDVPLAKQVSDQAWQNLSSLDAKLIGSKELLFDAEAVKKALDELKQESLELLLIMQVTFTDATMTVELAKAVKAPIVLWSFPEPRAGDRLRLNSFCGINLAGHSLGKADIKFDYLYKAADDKAAANEILSLAKARIVFNRLQDTRLAVIGNHPDGFDTCVYDKDQIKEWCGVTVDKIDLSDFLKQASAIPDSETDQVYKRVDQEVCNLEEMEIEPLRKSLKAYSALKNLAKDNNYHSLAVRCWPEFFTEYGCAACGAMAMMNEDAVPCGCEADLFGSLSTLILLWLSDSPAFLADLVDIDVNDNTGVLWHCGLAPLSMADKQVPARATIHTNRKKPFLYEFTLKPGRITILRLTQAKNKLQMVISGGEMIQAPMSFTGTSGVVKFDVSAERILDKIMREGLEHHYSIVYGDYRVALTKLANLLNIPVMEID